MKNRGQAGDAAEFLDKYGLESDPDATLRAIASAITHDIDNGAYPTFGIACLVEAQHRRNTTPASTTSTTRTAGMAGNTNPRDLAFPTPAGRQPPATPTSPTPSQAIKSAAHQHSATDSRLAPLVGLPRGPSATACHNTFLRQ